MKIVPNLGDIIVVTNSNWYALKSGERLRVCEPCWWNIENKTYNVAPLKGVSSFWDVDKEIFSTSGGPFTELKMDNDFVFLKQETSPFWRWKDYPCKDGGKNFFVKVNLFLLEKFGEYSISDD